ncbi:hypothetical protein [Nocardiopsis valliformis]|uniref:hypothetical protein n=1 Tax=Nocardiopsis valliformis TaxID=239974 RepID=UPI001268FF90|nr:hypothetical protein [Nocardiopsis valliformis]
MLRFPRVTLLVSAALVWAFLAVPGTAHDPLLLGVLAGAVAGSALVLDLWGYALRTPNAPAEAEWSPRRSAWSLTVAPVLFLPAPLLYLSANPDTVWAPVLGSLGTGLVYGLLLVGPLVCAVVSRTRLHACALAWAAREWFRGEVLVLLWTLLGLRYPKKRQGHPLSPLRRRRLAVLARREAAVLARALEEAPAEDPRTLRALSEADVALALLHGRPDEIDLVGSLVISGRVLRRLGVRPGDPDARVCHTNPLHGPSTGLGDTNMFKGPQRLEALCSWCLPRTPESRFRYYSLHPNVAGEPSGFASPRRARWTANAYGSRGTVRAQELLRRP